MYGDWTIEDGALKGRLSKKDLAEYEYHEADIALKGTEIPATVEVRYETWSPDLVGSETKFLTEAGDGGIVMACLGVTHPAFGAKGTMAFVFKDEAYRSVGRSPNAALAPKVRHKVRLVRKDDRATFFLDGERILSANVSDAKDFRDLSLHLVGTWGKRGRSSISTTSRCASLLIKNNSGGSVEPAVRGGRTFPGCPRQF